MASSSTGEVPADDSPTEYMSSALYWEAEKHHIGRAIEKDAQLLHQLRTRHGNTVLHICITSDRTLADKNKTTNKEDSSCCKFVKSVLQNCKELLMKRNEKQETPLHLAARYGNEPVVKILIEQAEALHNADIAKQMLTMVTKEKDTALHEAARFNHLRVVELLISEDPDHYKYNANEAGKIPLFIAVERGYNKVALAILSEWSSENSPNGDPHGRNVLHAAAIVGIHGDILGKWKQLSKETDDQGWTALHYAAEGKWELTVKQLLEFDKSAAYVQDKQGRTALHIAAWNGHEAIMKQIMMQCPDCCELVDKRGCNVLHFAVESDRFKAVKVITKEYSLSYLLNAADTEGNTPFHLIMPTDYRILQDFIKLRRLDMPALLSKKNQNAVGIVYANQKDVASTKRHITRRLRKQLREANKNNTDHGDESSALEKIENAKDSTLIAAILIATVTFAAAFTMPGGYMSSDSSKSEKPGTAVLGKKAAFQAFIITDTLAMLLSTGAVLSHILAVLHLDTSMKLSSYIWAVYLTTFAMIAFLIAFATGTYVVLGNSPGLAITVCVIVVFALLLYLLISARLHETFEMLLPRFRRPKKEAKNEVKNEVDNEVKIELNNEV